MPCSIESCSKPIFSSGWCQMHYRRFRVHGDPNKTLKVQRCASSGSAIRIEDNIAFVELTQGKEAVIDAADIAIVKQFNWNYSATSGYAYSGAAKTSLHQFLLGRAPIGMIIDHEDRNKLNCRRGNISFKFNSGNALNSDKSDRAKHISFHKASGKFQAYLQFERSFLYLGLYTNEELANVAIQQAYSIFAELGGNIAEFRAKWKLLRKHGEELKRDE